MEFLIVNQFIAFNIEGHISFHCNHLLLRKLIAFTILKRCDLIPCISFHTDIRLLLINLEAETFIRDWLAVAESCTGGDCEIFTVAVYCNSV